MLRCSEVILPIGSDIHSTTTYSPPPLLCSHLSHHQAIPDDLKRCLVSSSSCFALLLGSRRFGTHFMGLVSANLYMSFQFTSYQEKKSVLEV